MTFKAYKKKIQITLFFILGLLFLGVGIIYFYLYYASPKYSGEIHIKNIKSNVSIKRDSFGVPHINAENREDAFYALGWTMASDRLFQMEISRRAASGELSEIIGEETLKSDINFRNLKIRRTMEDNFYRNFDKIKNSPMFHLASRFFQGVNDYQSQNPLPIEFLILGIKPRPFSILDSYSFLGLMSYNFAVAIMQDPLLTTLEKRIGPELVDEMRVEMINSRKRAIVSKLETYRGKTHELVSFLEHGGIPLFDGSNGWILAKNRTTTNENMLMNDPHISFPHPGIWYEAHLKTPDFESYGHFLSLIPFPILSHNKERAWGLTMSLTDDMDLYKEKIIDDKSYQYIDKLYPLKKTKEVIKVKGKKDYEFEIKETIHGPILDEISDEKSLALKWAYYEPDNDPITTLYEMSFSKNMLEMKAAVSKGVAPGLNILYADKENIAWWIFGRVYQKPSHVRSDFLLDGSTGKDEYQKILGINDLPHLENPKSGIIISANFRPHGFPLDQRGDWQPDDRIKTLEFLLAKKEKWSIDEMKEIQTLSINLENKLILKELLTDLKNVPEAKDYIDLLSSWNLISDVDSIAATIFYTSINKVGAKLLSDLSSEEFKTYAKISTSYIFTKRVILNRNSAWWKKFDRMAVIKEAFVDTISTLKSRFGSDHKNWKWGNVHQLEFVHPIGRVRPFNYLFNLGPYPISGASQDINNQKSDSLKEEFSVKAGPSTRRIISFSDLNTAYGILPQGQSGHILSPFYKDQFPLYSKGLYRPMYLDIPVSEVGLELKLISGTQK